MYKRQIIVSTVLSLVIVPAFFLIMDDLSRLLARFFATFIGPKEAEPDEPAASVLAERIDALEAKIDGRPPQRGAPTLHVAE